VRRAKAERRLSWGLRICVILVAALLLGPTLVVIPMSFSAGETFQFPPKEWSLRWYVEFFSSAQWMNSLLTSIQIGLLVAVFATILGVGAAYALDRSRWRGRGAVRSAMMAPMIVPSIVVAIAIYSVFLKWHLNGTAIGFVLAHTVLAVPFVVTVVSTSLAGYDRTVETASASLGANSVTTFFRVTLPILLPGVASGFVFAFVTSLDEVVIALFLQTPSIRTLPVQMYDSITLEIDPTIGAASSLIVVATTLILLIPLLRPQRTELRS
jgi:putative spermidine/putrescine transport system permease protein